MITLSSTTRIFVYTDPTDMRKSFDGLAGLVKEYFQADLFSGHLFVFFNRRRDYVKILMWDIGGLRELAGLWSPPPFLANFLENLAARSALASPQVIQGWIEAIRDFVTQLSSAIADLSIEPDSELTEQLQYLMRQIADVFKTVQRTVEENCERIAAEVAEYRSLEDEHHLRARLSRLVSVQKNYLDPVIRILDVNGELHDVTSQVSSCCVRLETRLSHTGSAIAEEAVMRRRARIRLVSASACESVLSLRKGKHISVEDGVEFRDLTLNQDQYTTILGALGYSRHLPLA